MYEWQASLFDNDNLSSPLTFKRAKNMRCDKQPFQSKTDVQQLNKNQPSGKLPVVEHLTFYVKVNECCF